MGAQSSNNDRGAKWWDGDTTTGDVARATTDEGTSKAEVQHVRNYVYNSGTLSWDRMTQPGGGTGGAGDASAANQVLQLAQETASANALGTTADASSANTMIGLTKNIKAALAGTLAVSGTFWQTTQPVSIAGTVAVSGPLTDTQLRATPVPVSGTFFQGTQPVSIAATVAVSGPLTDTQLRATAVPVSGPLTDTQLRASAVPVSGTFFQGTQPVSIAATVAVSGPLTDTQLRASAVPVSGTFFQGTQPVSIAATVAVSGPLTDTQLRATPVPVSAAVASPAFVRLSDGAAALIGQKAMAASIPVVLASDQSDRMIFGTTRKEVQIIWDNLVTASAASAIVNGQSSTNFAALTAAAAAAYTVPASKRYRINAITFSCRASGSAPAVSAVAFRLVAHASGTPATTDPIIYTALLGHAANLGDDSGITVSFPMGIDVPAATSIGLAVADTAFAAGTATTNFSVTINGIEVDV